VATEYDSECGGTKLNIDGKPVAPALRRALESVGGRLHLGGRQRNHRLLFGTKLVLVLDRPAWSPIVERKISASGATSLAHQTLAVSRNICAFLRLVHGGL
jgi:hypothetical protein